MKVLQTNNFNAWTFSLCMSFIIFLSIGCKKTTEPEPPLLGTDAIGTVYDFDNNAYNLISIGNQGWLRENMKAVHYSNGDSIPYITSNPEWENTTQGAWCDYNNDSQHVMEYGRLYNWQAIHDSRNLCPKGFHVPTNDEYNKLINFLVDGQLPVGK